MKKKVYNAFRVRRTLITKTKFVIFPLKIEHTKAIFDKFVKSGKYATENIKHSTLMMMMTVCKYPCK